jgi:hypothetical protein
MKNKNFTQYIDQLIANAYLKEAIDALLVFFNKIPHNESANGLKNRVIVQSQRLMDALNSYVNGKSNKQDLDISKTNISISLTDIKNEINELEEYAYEFQTITIKEPEDKKKDKIEEDAGDYVDTQYQIFLKTLKRYWWAYTAFAVFAGFIVSDMFKHQKSFNEATDKMEAKLQTFPSTDCQILTGVFGIEVLKYPDKFNMTVIGKLPPDKWVKVDSITVSKGFGGEEYYFKVKIPSSNTEGWIMNFRIEERKGNCFPN